MLVLLGLEVFLIMLLTQCLSAPDQNGALLNRLTAETLCSNSCVLALHIIWQHVNEVLLHQTDWIGKDCLMPSWDLKVSMMVAEA